MKKIGHNGLVVLIVTLSLLVIGLVGVYSSSRIWANYLYDDSTYYVKRQFIFMIIGIILMFIGMKINKNMLYKYSNYILLFGLVLLVLVLIPGIGVERNGSRSWFAIGSLAIQPSEIFKVCMIIYASKYLTSNYDTSKKFYGTIIPLLIVTLLGFGLIMLQPDLGTGLVLVCSIIVMTLISKVGFKNYIFLGFSSLVGFAFVIISEPYRMSRITSYINPWEDPLGSGFQIIQSLYSIVPGGILGQGINNSIQKCYYLPEPQTDFIFAIVGEELGFVGGCTVIVLLTLIALECVLIAKRAKDLAGTLICTGMATIVGVQSFMNIAVATGLMPNTGIPLPFVSYGLTSLVSLYIGMGFVLNVGLQGVRKYS